MQRLLTALLQGNKDFFQYLANLTPHSNCLGLTEETMIWTLRVGLSPSLKEEVWSKDESTTFPAYIDLLKRSNIKMKAYQAEVGHHCSRPAQAHP